MIIKNKDKFFIASCAVGFILSCYALAVELKSENDKDYRAYCDINEYVSCTKAFSSKYADMIIKPLYKIVMFYYCI